MGFRDGSRTELRGARPGVSSLDIATKLVTPEVTVGWVLGLYPDAGEASGTFHFRAKPNRCATPGPAIDPDRAVSEAQRRARTRLRRYVAANRIFRMGSATYAGEGLRDEKALRRHIAHYFKQLRYRVIGEPYAYVWVPEWHPGGHGLHIHFGLDRHIKQRVLQEVWGRGIVDIRMFRSRRPAGKLEASRGAARYMSKYVAKSFEAQPHTRGLHRYELAQGFQPRVERIVATSRIEAIEMASDRMGKSPARLWNSEETDDWQGPPAMWMAWND